jgi:hypothetical protein
MAASSSPRTLISAILRYRPTLLTLLLFYLSQTLTFAFLYQVQHKRDSTAFVFNAAIIEKQNTLDERDLARALANVSMQLHALSLALTFPPLIRLDPHPAAHRIPRKDVVVLRFEKDNIETYISFSLGGLKEQGELWITDRKRPDWEGFHAEHRFNAPEKFYEGNGFETSSEASAQVVENFEFLIREEIARLQARNADLEKRIALLQTNGPEWQFTEYLYFSVIVLGGGSGDIIPNSREVRRVVIVQYLISVTIVCFLINGFGTSKAVSGTRITN